MEIAVYGLGYVGLTTAACLAKDGHSVLGIDVNGEKIRQINAGQSPIGEPGLDRLIKQAIAENRLACAEDAGDRLDTCDMAMVCVGTPGSPDGAHDMTFIADVSRQIALAIKPDRARPLVVVYRSTVRPGSMEGLIRPIFGTVLGSAIDAVELVYSPEFLRESTAIRDFFEPPKIVTGTRDGKPCALMDVLNQSIAAPRFQTRYREAELSKFVDNAFHALKIAFANEIGRLCLVSEIDVKIVHRMLVADSKLNVSAYYLRPGGAFGGSCLPKDVRALLSIAREADVSTPLVGALMSSNEAHKTFLYQCCTRNLRGPSKILMLGLAFKQDSDDLRDSPNVDLARSLLADGHHVSIFDPCLDLVRPIGHALAKLPPLGDLLIAVEDVVASRFDLVIDTNGSAPGLALSGGNILDIHTL